MAMEKRNECSCSFHIRILYFAFSILCFLTISMFVLTFCYVSQIGETRFCLPKASGQPFIQGTATLSRSDRSHRELVVAKGEHAHTNSLNENSHQTLEDENEFEDENGRIQDVERHHNGIYLENKRRLNATREKEEVNSPRERRDVNDADGRILQVLATVPISIPLSSIANVCNWTNEGCPRGPKGDPGPIGLSGQIGQRGLPGPRGEPGTRGKRGDRGPKGQSGENGDRGAPGENGNMGLPGPQGPPGNPGTRIENCSCLGVRRSAADNHGVTSVPLEELEAKMRRILLKSSISGVIIANDTSDKAEVIISGFKSVKRSAPTPVTTASHETTGVQNGMADDGSASHDSQLDPAGNNQDVSHSRIPDLDANHAYTVPDSHNMTARQPQSVDQYRTLKQSDNARPTNVNDRVAEGTIANTASAKPDMPTSFPARALNTESKTIVLTVQETPEGSSPSDNEAEQSSFLTDRNAVNDVRPGDDLYRMVTTSSKRTPDPRLPRMTTEAGNAAGDGTRMEIDDQKLMNISLLLQRLNELTANKTSLLNFVQMSISKTGTCGCPGPPGPVGPQGDVGPKGDMGMVGITGSKGERGDKGERGSLIDGDGHILQGPPGPKGDKGIAGTRGLKGDPGINGADGVMGIPGLQGDPGPRGTKGEVGDPGPMGSKGSKGGMGPMGTRGQMGYDGQKGRKGETGFMGQKGVPGSTGPFGPKGIKGEQGKRGEMGYPGLTGSPGPPGEPGAPGRDGIKGQKGDRHTYVLPGGSVATSDYPSLTPTSSNPTTKPANIDPDEKMFKIYEPIVNSKCRLTNISAPREIHTMARSYGVWMKDTYMDALQPDMIWVTMHHRGAILIEYKSLDDMKDRRLTSTFALPFQWGGTGHVVYNDSLYYHHRDTPYIIRYNLTSGSLVKRVQVPSLGHQGDLFKLSSGYTNVDFAVDENGLWIIYPLTRPGSVGKLAVSKLDPESLEIITTIATDHNFQSTANAFIVCGVLYTTKGPHSRPSRVDFAFDLLREVVLEDINMNIQNRHRKTVTLSYNPRDRLLYGWDKGRLLTYDLTIKEYIDE